MKMIKIFYWGSTSLIGLMMAYSAYAYLTQATADQGFQHLGFPAYFRIELALAKLIGIVLLLAPVAARIKEWAYAGFTFVFISAFIAHSTVGDPVSASVSPLIFLVLLIVSYVTYHKLYYKGLPESEKKNTYFPNEKEIVESLLIKAEK